MGNTSLSNLFKVRRVFLLDVTCTKDGLGHCFLIVQIWGQRKSLWDMNDAASFHWVKKPLVACSVIEGFFCTIIIVANDETFADVKGTGWSMLVVEASTAHWVIGGLLCRHSVWCHSSRSLACSPMQRWSDTHMLGRQLALSALMLLSYSPVHSLNAGQAKVIIDSLIVPLGMISWWDQVCFCLIQGNNRPSQSVFFW